MAMQLDEKSFERIHGALSQCFLVTQGTSWKGESEAGETMDRHLYELHVDLDVRHVHGVVV